MKKVLYILGPKPWDKPRDQHEDELMLQWWNINKERLAAKKQKAIDDGF